MAEVKRMIPKNGGQSETKAPYSGKGGDPGRVAMGSDLRATKSGFGKAKS